MILRVFWNGHVGGMGIFRGTGILPVSCLLWNWHLASFMLIVHLASFMLIVHLASFMLIVELASCQFHAYFRAGRMPTLLLFSAKTDATPNFFLFPIP
ncbi:hypothetical protein [Moorena producens]|uniref:hypothetical protein n=1 Tax=Moorena producens TaxID=1155739 RepID=UPI003C754E5E